MYVLINNNLSTANTKIKNTNMTLFYFEVILNHLTHSLNHDTFQIYILIILII